MNVIKYLRIKQNSTLNNPSGIDMMLNKFKEFNEIK